MSFQRLLRVHALLIILTVILFCPIIRSQIPEHISLGSPVEYTISSTSDPYRYFILHNTKNKYSEIIRIELKSLSGDKLMNIYVSSEYNSNDVVPMSSSPRAISAYKQPTQTTQIKFEVGIDKQGPVYITVFTPMEGSYKVVVKEPWSLITNIPIMILICFAGLVVGSMIIYFVGSLLVLIIRLLSYLLVGVLAIIVGIPYAIYQGFLEVLYLLKLKRRPGPEDAEVGNIVRSATGRKAANLKSVEGIEDLRISNEAKSVADEVACVICMSARRDIRFSPCKHICACTRCALLLIENDPKCPLCREKIQKVEQSLDI